MIGKPDDFKGKRFGHFTVIQRAVVPTTPGVAHWECICDCGVKFTRRGIVIRQSGVHASCGCQRLTAIRNDKKKRIESIRELAARKLRVQQIAAETGQTPTNIRKLAKRNNIELVDAVMGSSHHLNIGRIVSGTVLGAQSLVAGLELLDGNLNELDLSELESEFESLTTSLAALSRLHRQIRGAINGKKSSACQA